MATSFGDAFGGNWLSGIGQQDPAQSPQIAVDPSVYQQAQPSDAPQAQPNVMQQAQAAQAAPAADQSQPQQLGQVQPLVATQPAPRERLSLWDVVGRVGNALARVNPNGVQTYQTPLQIAQQKQLEQQKVDAGALDNRAKQQDIVQTGVATTAAANNVIGGYARGLQSLAASGIDPAKAAPALAAQMGLPPAQAQQLATFIAQHPANLDALVDATNPVPKTAAGKSLALAFTNAIGPDGKPALLQASADGTPHVLTGYTPLTDVKIVDRGTTQDIVNGKTGATVRSLTKSGAPESGTVASGVDANGQPIYSPLPNSARAAGIAHTNVETAKGQQQIEAAQTKQAEALKTQASAYAASQDAITSIRKNIDTLRKLQSQPSANQNTVGNAVNYFQSSGLGQHVTATINPAVQQARDQIKSAGQALLLSAAKGNGQLFRNQNEQKNFLDSINNPRSSIATMEEQLRLAQSRIGPPPAVPKTAPAASGWGKVTVSP